MFYGLMKGYSFGMKTSTGIIDYYLKCCIEGGFSKITTTGSYLQKRG
jgi:hypothetical protein